VALDAMRGVEQLASAGQGSGLGLRHALAHAMAARNSVRVSSFFMRFLQGRPERSQPVRPIVPRRGEERLIWINGPVPAAGDQKYPERHMLEYLVSLPYRLHRRGVSALRVRFAPQIAFIRARLSPRGYFGLRLTDGALVLIGASWLFGGISQDVVAGDPLTVVDVLVAQWFNAHSTPLLTQWMLAIMRLHDFVPLAAAVLLIASFLAWRRDWCWLIALGATVPFGMLLNIVMKYAFHRFAPAFRPSFTGVGVVQLSKRSCRWRDIVLRHPRCHPGVESQGMALARDHGAGCRWHGLAGVFQSYLPGRPLSK